MLGWSFIRVVVDSILEFRLFALWEAIAVQERIKPIFIFSGFGGFTIYISKIPTIFTTREECVLTLTDHCSIIMGVTVASVNEVAMSAAEQVCLRASTLDLTHSGRLGIITECTTCDSNSTYVYVCVCVCMHTCVQQQWVHEMCIAENCKIVKQTILLILCAFITAHKSFSLP